MSIKDVVRRRTIPRPKIYPAPKPKPLKITPPPRIEIPVRRPHTVSIRSIGRKVGEEMGYELYAWEEHLVAVPKGEDIFIRYVEEGEFETPYGWVDMKFVGNKVKVVFISGRSFETIYAYPVDGRKTDWAIRPDKDIIVAEVDGVDIKSPKGGDILIDPRHVFVRWAGIRMTVVKGAGKTIAYLFLSD
ncbi:MAG: hypothetical protein DRP01_09060 [Archaeoglobales archaeon]|nr:MAG: hypothetical protein DRP01_09060 [Archaeoglobales archaeon]